MAVSGHCHRCCVDDCCLCVSCCEIWCSGSDMAVNPGAWTTSRPSSSEVYRGYNLRTPGSVSSAAFSASKSGASSEANARANKMSFEAYGHSSCCIGRTDEGREDAKRTSLRTRSGPRGCAADMWTIRTRASHAVFCYATLRLFRAVCLYVCMSEASEAYIMTMS